MRPTRHLQATWVNGTTTAATNGVAVTVTVVAIANVANLANLANLAYRLVDRRVKYAYL